MKEIQLNSDIVKSLKDLLNVFSELKINYYICGSLASSIYGTFRSTQDIDLVSDINLSNVDVFYERLKDKYFIDKDMIKQAINSRSSFNLIHLDTMMKIDVFIKKDNQFHRISFERSIVDNLDLEANTIKVFISSPEDIILSKLLWYEEGNRISERQWGDILGVIKVQRKDLDINYLKNWAQNLNVFDLLTKSFSDSEMTFE